ncbi:MAG: hypothetical protein WA399_10475 [Acidobacteriaceae bacterium]
MQQGTSNSAITAHYNTADVQTLDGDEDLVQRVKADFQHAATSEKLKAHCW